MPQVTTRWTVPNSTKTVTEFWQISNTTLLANGKPNLFAQNPYQMKRDRNTFHREIPGKEGVLPIPWANINRNDRLTGVSWTATDNQAYGRFWGKLKYGGTSLGVTIAEWKSSRDMILEKFSIITRHIDRAERAALKLRKAEQRHIQRVIRRRGSRIYDVLDFEYLLYNGKRPKGTTATEWSLRKKAYQSSKEAANRHLEVVFGWDPLIQDVKGAFTSLCQHAVPPEWVRGSGKTFIQRETGLDDTYTVTLKQWEGWCRTVYCCNVNISNPNLWLANRAGLIALPAVAWDLVPWSFVVNMFVNVNTILGALTDEVGLNLTDHSITRTIVQIHYLQVTPGRYSKNYGASSNGTYLYKEKTRSVGAPLKPKIQLKVPDLSPQLLATGAALIVQKLLKVGKLLGI